MDRAWAASAGRLTWLAAYVLVAASVVVVAGAIGIALWNGGYGLVGGLLLGVAAGGAACTVWMAFGGVLSHRPSDADPAERD
jgi:hypothetical protein